MERPITVTEMTEWAYPAWMLSVDNSALNDDNKTWEPSITMIGQYTGYVKLWKPYEAHRGHIPECRFAIHKLDQCVQTLNECWNGNLANTQTLTGGRADGGTLQTCRSSYNILINSDGNVFSDPEYFSLDVATFPEAIHILQEIAATIPDLTVPAEKITSLDESLLAQRTTVHR